MGSCGPRDLKDGGKKQYVIRNERGKHGHHTTSNSSPSTLSIICGYWQSAKAREVKKAMFLMPAGCMGCPLSKFCYVYLEEHLHNPIPHLLPASLLLEGCESRLPFQEVFQSQLSGDKSIVMYSAKPQAFGPRHPVYNQEGNQEQSHSSGQLLLLPGSLTLRIRPGVKTYLCSVTPSMQVVPRIYQMFLQLTQLQALSGECRALQFPNVF